MFLKQYMAKLMNEENSWGNDTLRE